MISVSIVEDHSVFRQVLTEYLEKDSRFKVLGSYRSGREAMAGLVIDKPDIAIVDIQMPEINGIELIGKIKRDVPNTQFLICTSHYDNENIFKALENGATGYILKDDSNIAITNAIVDLHNGGSPMSPFIARKVISKFQAPQPAVEDFMLTKREHEILSMLAKGLIYKEIAEQLIISPLTVAKHLKNIYRKLHVQNKVEALNKYKL